MSHPGTERDAASIDERWRALAAPLGAAIVLILGISLLFFRGTGDANVADPDDDERTTEPRETIEPEADTTVVDSGVPIPTPPPLFEPTTVPLESPTLPPTTAPPVTSTEVPPATTTALPPKTTPPPTSTPTVTTAPQAREDGPTSAQVQSALVELGDLDNVNWREDTIEDVPDPCSDNPDADSAVVNEAVLYSRLQIEPFAIRQLSNRIISFGDAATAERYFATELTNIQACDGETIDIGGVDYALSVVSQTFSDEQAAAFPCADDSVLLILQLTSDDADVPYLGDTVASFRCGRNVMFVSFTSTLDLDDLDDPDFFTALALSNVAVADLPGS